MSIKANNVYHIFLAQIFLIIFFSFENKESSLAQHKEHKLMDKTPTTIAHQ